MLFQAAVVILGAALAGCEFKGRQPLPDSAPMAGAWVPQATTMRVYPATRFTHHNDEPVLEARVELFDDMGDSVKGSGSYRFELRDANGTGDERQRLYTWDVDVLTLKDHQEHYDPITRSYVFPLRLDDAAVAQRQTVLRVVFTRAEGKRLETEDAVTPSP